jgi:hypothetical protein
MGATKVESMWSVTASEILVTEDSDYFRRLNLYKAIFTLPAGHGFANSVTEKNRPLNFLRFVEPTFFSYVAPMQWVPHLVPHS